MKRPPRPHRRGTQGAGIALIMLLAVIVSPPAHAYLDPSTGSMIVTAIVGLLASIGLAIRTYWYRLKSFFKGGRNRQPRGDDSVQSGQNSDSPESPSG